MATTDWRAVHRLAAQLEPSLRRAFLRAVDRLRGRVNVDALAATLQAGQPTATAGVLLAAEQFPAHLRDAVATVNEAFRRGGRLAASRLGASLGTAMQFDAVNPFAVRAVERYGARLVRRVDRETRLAIRGIIRDSITQGIAPRDTAKLVREVIGLDRHAARAVKRRRFDLLASGASAQAVDRGVAAYAARKLRERALTIARTEILGALNAGQLEAMKQAVRDGLLGADARKIWIITPFDACRLCRSLADQERPISEPFVDEDGVAIMAPTRHPNCRCTLAAVPASIAARAAA